MPPSSRKRSSSSDMKLRAMVLGGSCQQRACSGAGAGALTTVGGCWASSRRRGPARSCAGRSGSTTWRGRMRSRVGDVEWMRWSDGELGDGMVKYARWADARSDDLRVFHAGRRAGGQAGSKHDMGSLFLWRVGSNLPLMEPTLTVHPFLVGRSGVHQGPRAAHGVDDAACESLSRRAPASSPALPAGRVRGASRSLDTRCCE